MTKKSRLVLQDDGRVFRQIVDETEVTVDLADYLRRDIAQDMAFLTPDVGPVPEVRAQKTRFLFRLTSGAWECSVGFLLDGLNFHTNFETIEDRLTPGFNPGGAQINPAKAGILQHKFVGFNPWFVVTPGMVPQASLAGFARHEGRRRLATLPLPNVFDDGKLCLGDGNGYADPGDPLPKRAETLLAKWLASPWNQDLFCPEKSAACRKLFSWTLDGEQVHPGREDLWELCPAISPGVHTAAAKFFEALAAEEGGDE